MIRTNNRWLSSLARARSRERQRGFLLNPYRFAVGGGAAYNVTYSGGSTGNGGNQGLTELRCIIPASATHAGSKVRLTLRSGAATFNATAVYLGFQAASGDVYDFASAPVRAQTGGSNTFNPGGASTNIVSDDIIFAPDGTTNLLMSAYISSGFPGADSPGGGWATYYNGFGSAATAAQVDVTGYTIFGTTQILINKIEIFY